MKTGKKWYKSISNWIIIIACLILIPVLIINLSIIFQAKTNKDKVPSIFGYKPFMVLSGSMENKIHKGDLIITKIVDPESVKVDDVIAFRDAENTVTTHRIIDMVEEEGETYFITKGDNNGTQDQNLVSLDDIEGIYVGRIPGIGSIMSSLSEPTSIIIVILGVTIIFVIGFSISNKKQREIERKEFLEFKKMKEEMLESKANRTKKTKSIKAEEDDDELLKVEEKIKPQIKKKTTSTNTAKKKTTTSPKRSSTTKKSTSSSKKTNKSTKA